MTIASSLFSGLRLPAFGRSTKDTLPFPVSKRPLDTAEARQSTPPSLPLPVAISSSGTSSETATNVANIADIDQRDHETVVNEKIDVEAQQYEVKPPPKIPRLARLPTWISFWLGYRKVTPPPEKNYVVWIWSFVGSFACISILQALFGNTKVFVERGVPSIVSTSLKKLFISSFDNRSSSRRYAGSNRYSSLRRDRVTAVATATGNRRPSRRVAHRDLHHQTLLLATHPRAV